MGDDAISPLSSIAYYESVRSFLAKYPDPRSQSSKPVQAFYRLFMVPGMGHCGGGFGPNAFGNTGGAPGDSERDILTALERWGEKGTAPDKLIGAAKVPDDPVRSLTRPLCVYPKVTRYKGSGDPYDATNFECAAGQR